LTIVEADPGTGKSYFMHMVCAAVCDGKRLPSEGALNGWEKIKQSRVYYLGVEDGISAVIKPRLVDNKMKHFENFMVNDQAFTMDEEGLARVETVVEEFKPSLVVFDTLNYYIGGIDIHRANEVSTQLEHFTRLAKTHNIAVVIIRHLTKNSTGGVSALHRGMGSVAFTGTAREVLALGLNPDDPDMKIVAVTKFNMGPMPKALGFRILETGDRKSLFEWDENFYTLTSDDIINVRRTSKSPNALDEAIKYLKEKLKDGMIESLLLNKDAEARGISHRTLVRARQQLSVKVIRKNDKWYSSL
jgi:hypothetical protein